MDFILPMLVQKTLTILNGSGRNAIADDDYEEAVATAGPSSLHEITTDSCGLLSSHNDCFVLGVVPMCSHAALTSKSIGELASLRCVCMLLLEHPVLGTRTIHDTHTTVYAHMTLVHMCHASSTPTPSCHLAPNRDLMLVAAPPHKDYGVHWLLEHSCTRDAQAFGDLVFVRLRLGPAFGVTYTMHRAAWTANGQPDWVTAAASPPLPNSNKFMDFTTPFSTWHHELVGSPSTHSSHATPSLLSDSARLWSMVQGINLSSVTRSGAAPSNDYIDAAMRTEHLPPSTEMPCMQDDCFVTSTGSLVALQLWQLIMIWPNIVGKLVGMDRMELLGALHS